MKKSSLDPRTIALCFGLALILLGWVSVVSYWSTHQLVRSFNGVGQAHQALEALQTIQLQMESAESSVRGFVITGDNRRLAAYQSARDVVPAKLRDLEILMSGRSLSQKSFKRLRRLLSSHLIYLSNTVAQRRADGYAAAAQWIAAEDDSSNRDAMEAMLGALQKDGLVQVRKRGSSTAEHSLRTKIALGAASAATLLILVWIFGLLLRETSVRRQAESVTDQTEKFLRSIVEHIPYMILVKQAKDLRLTLVNKTAQQWLGRSEDDLLRSNAFDLRPREEAVASIQKDRQALQDGKPIDVPEQPLQVPGQDERLLRTQKIPVFDDWGRPAFLLTISEDITQRKQAEKMLELSRDAAVESARLKSEFIRNMSHEIRTPLSVVIGMTDLLLDTTLGAEQRRFASTIRRAAEGLLGLSKSILDFSKIESGAFALETRELDVRKIVDEIAAMLRPQAKAKSVNLATLVDGAVPAVVRGDPTRLRQVLTHIVGNAVKFTARGDVIVRVLQRRESDAQSWLHFRVSDTGIGIHADYQKELFQPFRQGDGSRTRRYGGTGLGLAVSKRIVDLMGGEIGFDSIPDQGSTFWWTIPFNKRHVEGPVVDGPSPNWARSRVLVVDENETVRQILQEQLQTWALASETASGGQTALEALRHEQQAGRAFPIVILDMHLPDMDAVAFARAVRQDATLSGTKLLVMTSPDSPLEPATSASLGFSGWVAKPPAPEDLYERLATLIEPPHLPHKHAA